LEIGDPTEIALVQMGEDVNASKEKLEKEFKRIDELPFDSDRKMMSTLYEKNGETIMWTKGAIDEMLAHTTHILIDGKIREISSSDIKKIHDAIKVQSAEALRVLGLAMRKGVKKAEEKNLVFVGLVGMIDPPRPEAKAAVETFKKAGVRTIMITGDHKDTAFAIAKQLGIADKPNQILEGSDIDEIGDGLFDIIEDLRVFARVSPEHKVKIVQALKKKGHIVSMTGDGVNDAPSLKTADIGVAMGITGTDVAKGAADMVLTDDNFATIEKAIEEGRGIYENIKKSVIFLLSSNFGEIITMFFAILIGLPAPLTAIQILWINLITDSLPGLALGVDVNDKKEIMTLSKQQSKKQAKTN
ncbi:cation-translocating P-type ATPase, partial [Treponema sp. R6D11]